MYEKRMGMKRETLMKVLWGDYYMDPKTKRVLPGSKLPAKKKLSPLFVSFILDNIWAVYKATFINRNDETIQKIISTLNLRVLPRELRTSDNKALLNVMMSRWLPLASCVLLSVADKIESPAQAQHRRLSYFLESVAEASKIPLDIRAAIEKCDRAGPVISYISKVLTIPESAFDNLKTAEGSRESQASDYTKAREMADKARREAERIPDTETDHDSSDNRPDRVLGLTRTYSGTLAVGQTVNVLGPKYSIDNPSQHCDTMTITGLYILMGRDLVPIQECPAGNIVAVEGIGEKVLKTATLTSVKDFPSLSSQASNSPPIVRVAIEPVNPSDMAKFEKGLELLNISDPCVQVSIQHTGEHILATAGELHLERCLNDLRERFAKVDVSVSAPMVPFRESIVSSNDMAPPKNGIRGETRAQIGKYTIKLRTQPLQRELTEYLTKTGSVIGRLYMGKENDEEEESEIIVGKEHINMSLESIKLEMEKISKTLRNPININNVLAIGPRHRGANLLVGACETGIEKIFGETDETTKVPAYVSDSIINGFQLATSQGPLCAEPLQGVLCTVTEIKEEEEEESTGSSDRRGITIISNSIKAGFMDWSSRIMLATYSCEIQTSAEMLGRVYQVLTRRKGKVISEEMKDGTSVFLVKADIPVVEAFGFADEIRKRTSGAAQPQLVFRGFEIYDQDPFWVPTTEEELEDYGEVMDKENVAKKYIDNVRRRKGLRVEELVVANSEKQRTLRH
ncbi:hypothetical protein CANCADRAFT_32310 [Tortispora caseinolytica NRRL Y-17796]|uniref:Elongation factor-like 1 n=1 Tax=Tortispora caseinolytica NRRL Y-17796 TaxID=767744 RepID=A0A1E4TAU3_9ASCO|nr:hypothetical protein CANCADRAFT_32310 [Tortispora caseinolytica NRRL Y-17796]